MATLVLTQASIDTFCEYLQGQGRKDETIAAYRRYLLTLFSVLPEDKKLTEDSIKGYIALLKERYKSPRTVNNYISGLNSFLQYSGQRNLCAPGALVDKEERKPVLSRAEYCRLLQAAKHTENDKVYFLIKVFGTVGIPVQNLPDVTVQALREGCVKLPEETLVIPDCLRRELLDYVDKRGIREGTVFLDGNGNPIHRSAVAAAIKNLCKVALVEEKKANPRCLRKLCFATKDRFYAEMIKLAERDYERFLESEQPVYGWELT